MKPEWAESVRVQCEEQDVAFFFKQWGGWGADGQRRAKPVSYTHLDVYKRQSWCLTRL